MFWSPDGQSIGFFAGGKLKRVDLTTGAVQAIADTPSSTGGSWSRDGVILFAPQQGPIFRVSQAGGPVTAVTAVDRPEIRHVSPQFLPDGRRFLFFVTGDPRARGVYVGWIDGSQPPRRLLEGLEASAVYAMSGHLLFPRDGALMVQPFDVATLTFSGEPRQLVENIRMDVTQGLTHVSVSETGALVYRRALGEGETQRRLVWLDREGREIRQLDAREPVNSNQLALSPDGQRLVVGNPADGLWMMDTERGTRTRFTVDTNDSFPLWSRDGNVLVYTSLRDGVRNLYHRSLAGGDAERLLASPGSKAAHDWSPDGRLLLYRDFDPKTRSDLWVIPVEPAGQPGRVRVPTDGRAAPVVQTPAQEQNGQFSPDGEWIAYDSDESDRREIYIQPFRRQGTKQRVSIDGGSQPRWRADGAELFFVSLNGQLMAAPIRRGADRSMAPGSPVSLFPVSLRVGV